MRGFARRGGPFFRPGPGPYVDTCAHAKFWDDLPTWAPSRDCRRARFRVGRRSAAAGGGRTTAAQPPPPAGGGRRRPPPEAEAAAACRRRRPPAAAAIYAEAAAASGRGGRRHMPRRPPPTLGPPLPTVHSKIILARKKLLSHKKYTQIPDDARKTTPIARECRETPRPPVSLRLSRAVSRGHAVAVG